MHVRFSLLALSLLAPLAHADKVVDSVSQLHPIAMITTPASSSEVFRQQESQVREALIAAIQGKAERLTREQLEKANQKGKLADYEWLKSSGYDFAKKENQQAGIELLESFKTLPATTFKANLDGVESVNLHATASERHQALVDAEGQNYLFFLSEALGPKLGPAFVSAYQRGELDKAAALIKSSEVSTSAAKKYFNNPRPFLIPGNTIHFVPDDTVVKDKVPYRASEGSFPSGHTNTAYTDALLLAEMLPERFAPLLNRAARYGYSRMVLGVHYPIDLIGSRMVAQRNVAHYLNDPQYRVLFSEAKQQLRTALEKECGTTLVVCANGTGKDDPYRSGAMNQFYHLTMTYGLPREMVAKNKVKVPEGAEVLLEGPLPHLTPAQRRQLMVNTAIQAGYPLSGHSPEQNFWQRVDLLSAVSEAAR
ncbi:MAG: Major phosphate-irrepressible acid phosphatase [Candidatus Erwinia impunctatus]|nr:Major phosphate-irrepressible acid phosphatase [Culicoides impunctatus]